MHVAVFATIKDGMRKKRQDLEAEFAAPVIVVSVAGAVAAVPAHGAADGPALRRVSARRR